MFNNITRFLSKDVKDVLSLMYRIDPDNLASIEAFTLDELYILQEIVAYMENTPLERPPSATAAEAANEIADNSAILQKINDEILNRTTRNEDRYAAFDKLSKEERLQEVNDLFKSLGFD